jgi:hypothetical protein
VRCGPTGVGGPFAAALPPVARCYGATFRGGASTWQKGSSTHVFLAACRTGAVPGARLRRRGAAGPGGRAPAGGAHRAGTGLAAGDGGDGRGHGHDPVRRVRVQLLRQGLRDPGPLRRDLREHRGRPGRHAPRPRPRHRHPARQRRVAHPGPGRPGRRPPARQGPGGPPVSAASTTPTTRSTRGSRTTSPSGGRSSPEHGTEPGVCCRTCPAAAHAERSAGTPQPSVRPSSWPKPVDRLWCDDPGNPRCRTPGPPTGPTPRRASTSGWCCRGTSR